MRSVIRVLIAVVLVVVFVGLPLVCIAGTVRWLRSGEPPEWPFDLSQFAAASQVIAGLGLAMVGGVVIGMRRRPENTWPHILQLWGAGLIVEGVLQITFMVAPAIGAWDGDNVHNELPWPFLWTVAVLALVVTPTLVLWRTSMLLRRARSTA